MIGIVAGCLCYLHYSNLYSPWQSAASNYYFDSNYLSDFTIINTIAVITIASFVADIVVAASVDRLLGCLLQKDLRLGRQDCFLVLVDLGRTAKAHLAVIGWSVLFIINGDFGCSSGGFDAGMSCDGRVFAEERFGAAADWLVLARNVVVRC